MIIQRLDPHDPAAMRAYHEAYHTSTTFGRAYATPWMLEEMRAEFQADNPGMKTLGWSGIREGRVVVTGAMHLPLNDNLTQAWIEVNTVPEHRNRGLGSAMLEHLDAVAAEHGRHVVVTEVSYPYDAPSDGSGHPYVEFLVHRGFTLGLAEVQRVLDLPVDERLLHALADEAAPYHRDYTIRQFIGPVPDDIIDSFGKLLGALATEAPTGDIDYEREVFDAARIRADEQVFEASGRTRYTTVAIAPDGTCAAYSDLFVAQHDPGRVYQWGTLALPEHRGHRLGLATKARNLLLLQRERGDLRLVVTFNAEENTHMIAVNERLGFRPVERLAQFQRKPAARG